MIKSGKVFFKDKIAGRVWLDEEANQYGFQYHSSYVSRNAIPISFTLPVRAEPFISPTMIPFFDGLIPEGWLLGIVVKNWKIDAGDRMGLLLSACEDCIGAVSIIGDQHHEE